MHLTIDTSTELGQLLLATNAAKPKKDAQMALHLYLHQHGPAELAKMGNLAQQMQLSLIEEKFRSNYGVYVGVRVHLEELQRQLGYEAAPALERVLIDQVCLTWLRLHVLENQYDQLTKGATLGVATFWEKTLSAHQKRFLRAVEALGRVRKLSVNVQINLADKQLVVNQPTNQ